MPAASEPPDELRELAGLELDRRRLVRKLIAVHVAINQLQCQIQDRGIEISWIKKGLAENPICLNRLLQGVDRLCLSIELLQGATDRAGTHTDAHLCVGAIQ